MADYLGEFDTNFTLSKEDMALHYIGQYGQIDGGHHKTWVLDQVARILLDAPVTVKEARWSNGLKECRFTVGTSQRYEGWVEEMRGEEVDGEREYGYDEGVAP